LFAPKYRIKIVFKELWLIFFTIVRYYKLIQGISIIERVESEALKDNRKGKSYFSVGRRRRRRTLTIIVPIAIVIVATMVGMFYMSGSKLHSSQMVLHNHVQLDVALNGISMPVPAHIGMSQAGEDSLLYGDHSLDQYGMQGMSPLHTHDDKGTIHVESNTVRDFTLGEFLNIWRGIDTNGKTVNALLDGKPVTDYRNIILKDGEKINLDIKS